MTKIVRIGMVFLSMSLTSSRVVVADTVIPPDTTFSGMLLDSVLVWFAVPVKVDGSLSVTLTPNGPHNLGLLLCTPTKDSLITTDCWGRPATLSLNGVKPDTFHFCIWNYPTQPGGGGRDYTLTTAFAAAELENDAEPNDSSALALSLPLSGIVTGHIGYDGRWASNPADLHDWWKITTVEDGALAVSIMQVEPVNLQLALYRPAGDTVIVQADTWGDTTSLSINNLRDGTYFVRVARYAWNFTPYVVATGFTAAPGGNDPEPNNVMGDASALTAGVLSPGHLGYEGFRADYGLDLVDWWHFTLTDTGDVRVALTQVALANLNLQLFESDGSTLVHGGGDTWGQGYIMDVSRAVPGEYYLRVRTYGMSDSYAIVLSIQGVTAADDHEAEDAVKVPDRFTLLQNYPNPFNPSTTIRYGLPSRSHVTLTVFNTLGQQVAVLQNGGQQAGYHETVFDASALASGVYLYRLRVRPLDSAIGRDSKSGAGEFVQTRKLVLLQ